MLHLHDGQLDLPMALSQQSAVYFLACEVDALVVHFLDVRVPGIVIGQLSADSQSTESIYV